MGIPKPSADQRKTFAKVIVWWALWSDGVIGPYFFENAQEMAITANSERYGHMLSDYLWR